MIEAKNLTFAYPGNSKPVIDDISFKIQQGGIYGLLGPNGAGKSTLLYLIAGLLTPKFGEVTLNGVNTRLRLPQTLADMMIVPEEFELPKIKLSRYTAIQRQYYPNFSEQDLKESLESFGFHGDFNLGALSMGQKKKVYMCIALAANTPLLLMDEPTNGLDIPSKASFRSFIGSRMTDERTIIISTHQVRDVSQLIENVLIMDHNQIVLNRSIPEIMNHLCFISTKDPALIAQALYAQPDVMGTRIAIPNNGTLETEVDLELLFLLATNHPDLMERVFQTPPPFTGNDSQFNSNPL